MPCAQCHKPIAVDPESGKCFNCLTGSGDTASKYRNQRTEYRGRTYDSKAEADRAAELDVMQRSDAIRAFVPQPALQLTDSVRYTADFLVVDCDGNAWYEDVKGVETERFRVIRQLWPSTAPLELHVLKRRRGGGWDREIIKPERK